MIGRTSLTNLESKSRKLYKDLDTLDSQRQKLLNNIQETDNGIAYQNWRRTAPKMYYEPLQDFYTFNEIEELESFFGQKTPLTVSTELTSLF